MWRLMWNRMPRGAGRSVTGAGRPFEVKRESRDVLCVCALRQRRQVSDLHVLEHALTKRSHRCSSAEWPGRFRACASEPIEALRSNGGKIQRLGKSLNGRAGNYREAVWCNVSYRQALHSGEGCDPSFVRQHHSWAKEVLNLEAHYASLIVGGHRIAELARTATSIG